MNPIKANIPNFITCINLAAGCAAIAVAPSAAAPLWGMKAFQWAFIFIAIGAVADFLDGFAARALHAYSNLGKELDSLCDLVTFGVAPAMILFNLCASQGAAEWLRWATLLIPVAGAIRLARFNIDTRQTSSFIGLPIPANAIFWIGYAAMAMQGAAFLFRWYCLLPVIFIECWLMNSPLRIFSLKLKTLKSRDNLPRLILVIAAAALCAAFGAGGLLWLIVFYVLLSLVCPPKS